VTVAEHTPGPWVAEFSEAVSVLDGERGRVCTINWLKGPYGAFGRKPDAEGEANARLIAAAPDLLAALKAVVAIADRKTDEFDLARAAIAKAEGRASLDPHNQGETEK
jgi:hypothetical protein